MTCEVCGGIGVLFFRPLSEPAIPHVKRCDNCGTFASDLDAMDAVENGFRQCMGVQPLTDLHVAEALELPKAACLFKQVWAATFGSAFAHQLLQRQRDGRDPTEPGFLEGAAEEAESIADLAVEHVCRRRTS